MPSTNQAGSRNHRRFPAVQEDVGEDPARFLDRDLVGRSNNQLFVKARIRGIDTIATLRAWKAVERALGRGPAGGPREGVVRLLEHREERLKEIGERPDRLEHGPRLPPEWFDPESSEVEPEQLSATQKLARLRAADGGEA